jgi:beta-glucosidase
MKVALTLHHFTDPIWFAEKGAWLNPKASELFESFTRKVVQELGDLIDFYITFNEPNIKILGGYAAGSTPPGIRDFNKVGTAFANLLKAHAAAYHVIHSYNPESMVGIAHHMRVFAPARRFHPIDIMLARYFDRFWNDQILDAIETGFISLRVPIMKLLKEKSDHQHIYLIHHC